MTDQQALTEAIKVFAEEERRKINDHFDSSALKSYLKKQTSEDETERIRDHLALCPRCADRALRLKTDASPIKRLVAALSAMLRSPGFAYGAAAVFLVVAAGASWEVVKLKQTISESNQPVPNIQHVSLSLDQTRDATPSRQLATDSPYNFTLVLHGLSSATSYAVVLVRKTSEGDEVAWSQDGLSRQDDGGTGYLSFFVPAGYLNPGSYVARFFAVGAGRAPLGEDVFTISESAVE